MKKLLLALAAVVILLLVGVVVAPSLVDLRPYVAAAVRDATGRELRIEGPLQVALLPKLRVAASGIHLANAPGAATPEMAKVESVALEVELWPLLARRLVVRSLEVVAPELDLEIDAAGRPNWEFAAATETKPEKQAAGSGGALAGIELGAMRIERGRLSYRDAATGQTIDVQQATLAAAMPSAETPLTLTGSMVLNGENVTTEVSVATLAKLQHGERAAVKLALGTRHLTAGFDGAARQAPVPGLDGVFDLDVPSVGQLAAWLKQPLDQADPGPLKIHAAFASDGTKSTLKEARLTGRGLDATMSGSLDRSTEVVKLSATIESGMVDVDRYLPPRLRGTQAGAAPAKAAHAAAKPAADPLGSLSDEKFDLAALRKVDADIKVAIAGVKAMGYEIGRIAFTTTAKGGVVVADLAELALYGGNVRGTTKLDAAGDALGVESALKVDRVTIDRLLQQALAGPPPASGAVSATLNVQARGKSPRALAADLRGHLAADLGGAALKDAGRLALSQLKLDLDLPGAEKAPAFTATGVYNAERVAVTATLPPLPKLASGERAPAALAVDSKLVTLRYTGALQQKPAPALDGTLDLDAPSVGKLAAWAGQPLGAGQPDPGALKVHAVLAGEAEKLVLRTASVTGKALNVAAQGSFDRSRAPARFDVSVDVREANLDAYLPAEQPAAAAKPGAGKPAPAPAATEWSTEPFELGSLAGASGQAEVKLAGVRYRGLEISRGLVKLALADRVLKLNAEKIAAARGTIDGTATLDGAGEAARLAASVAIAGVEAQPLLKAFADTDRLSGTIAFATSVAGSGRNQKELISSLAGDGSVKVTDGAIHGINLAATLRKAGSLGFSGSPAEKTDFAELGGTYTIKAGVVENRDLKMLAPLVRLAGQGTVPLPARTIDYTVEAKLVATTEGQGGREGLAGMPIPIRVTGPWSSPRYDVDWASVFEAVAKDPDRLKTLPADLGKVAKGVGVALPGVGAAGSSMPLDLTKKPLPLPSPPQPPSAQSPAGQPPRPALPLPMFGK